MTKEKKKRTFSRRKFLVRSAIGSGVLLGVGCMVKRPMRRYVANMMEEFDMPYVNFEDPNIWFEITSDNNIIFYSPKVEMGQGVFTGLAQIAAEELDVDISQLKVVHANSVDGPLDHFVTGGSTSISSLWVPLRELAATMREMLKNEAARLMDIQVQDLRTENGIISGGGKQMTYGEVVAKVKKWNVPKTPILKSTKEYKYIGKAIPRVDLKMKVMGEPIFGIDEVLPDMLYGAVVRPSSVDSSFVSADITKASTMPGVIKVLVEKDFVGVVATSKTEADNAKKALVVKWKINKIWEQKDVLDMIKVGKGTPIEIQKEGRAKKILEETTELITAEYTSPIGAHAQLEPNGALADYKDGKVSIRISTQVVRITRDEVAKKLGLKKKDVEIRPSFLGGGFGRRLHTPNAIQAALLSKSVGKPVHCFFDRKEEFQNDTFRPPTHHLLKAKLGSDGLIEAIEHNVSSGDVAFGSPMVPSITSHIVGADFGAWRGGMIQYEKIPHFRAVSWRVKLPFATSWWRSLGLLANTFAIESFIDELAEKSAKDPVQFRLDQIQDNQRGIRLKEVIKAAASGANWNNKVIGNRAMGFACSTDTNTPVAQVVDLSIVDHRIIIHKVTCAIDPGMVINPDGVRAQCEGAIIMGISASLYEKMEIEKGEIYPTLYGPYQLTTMRNSPREIEVIILENGDKPGAVGEPPLGPIGAAMANAIYRIKGKRIRNLPLSNYIN